MDKNRDLLVCDIMNTEVIILPSTAIVQEAAKLMQENEIGSIVIVDPENQYKPIGIITERDINNKLVAEDRLPSTVLCEEIMSRPVKSISPKLPLITAMHQMATQHIKRLIVMEKQNMIGIISQSDILEIAPYMIEVLQEMAENVKEYYETEYLAGYCELCENWSDMLEEVDHKFICQQCKTPKKPSIF